MKSHPKVSFGIFDKLLFLHLLSTTLLFAFILTSYSNLQKQSFENAFIEKSSLIRELLETTCVDPVVNTIAYDRTGKIIETIYRKNQEIAYIEIYDPAARIIFSIGQVPTLHLSQEDISHQFRQNAATQASNFNQGTPQFITPLSVDGDGLGVIRVGITKKYLKRQLKNSILFFLGIFLIAIAITGLIYFIFTNRWILRPVIDLSRMMKEYQEDDLSGLSRHLRIYNENISQDEIGTMALTFEKMIISISARTQEKERAEKKLAAEHERLLVTLRSIGDGVITSDNNGKVVLLNKVAEQLTGWKQVDAVGKTVSEIFKIIDDRTQQPCADPVVRILNSGKIITLDHHTVLIDRNGNRRNIADSGAPIRDPESRIIGTILVFRDVTEELLQEKEMLKVRKLESVGVLAAGIAHDFNNILVAIIGNLSLAREFIQPETKASALVREAEKAAQRAKGLTLQLLTFAKGGDPIKRETSLARLITEPANFVLSGSNVAMTCNLQNDLWAIEVDPDQISQVIQNLIINAKQAMPDGGTIAIEGCNIEDNELIVLPTKLKPANYVRLTIKDTGIGMPAEIIEKIFDPYFTTKTEGSGLGLAVCHSILSKHGGHISVDSKLGQGTVFILYLPATGFPPKDSVVKTDLPFRQKGQGKIMIMDDEEIIREVAEEILTHLGYEVLSVTDGAEAVDLYKTALGNEAPIDVTIMDLTIPGGMGGKEAVKKILELDSKAKVIVSSGYCNDPVMANFKEYGFAAMVAKPFDFAELGKVIRAVLGGTS
ncbi:MAG: response regulator [Deltaproteobacteria bacterium]|nr:response regulator [Deltaproteobacteria bacterium]